MTVRGRKITNLPVATPAGTDKVPAIQADSDAVALTLADIGAYALSSPISFGFGDYDVLTIDPTDYKARFMPPRRFVAQQLGDMLWNPIQSGRIIHYSFNATGPGNFTLPTSSDYPIGFWIDVVNTSAHNVTFTQPGGVTLRFLPSGGTGNRTLASYGRATLTKITSTIWIIEGNSGLT